MHPRWIAAAALAAGLATSAHAEDGASLWNRALTRLGQGAVAEAEALLDQGLILDDDADRDEPRPERRRRRVATRELRACLFAARGDVARSTRASSGTASRPGSRAMTRRRRSTKGRPSSRSWRGSREHAPTGSGPAARSHSTPASSEGGRRARSSPVGVIAGG